VSRNRILALALAFGALAAPAGAAAAGPVQVVVGDICSRSYGCDPQIRVAAASDAPIDLTVRDDGAETVLSSAGGLWPSSRRLDASIAPCRVLDARSVACPARTSIEGIAGGPGADRLDASGTAGLGLVLAGGPGDDTLIAGARGGTLRGGPGHDTLVGGPEGAFAALDDHRAALRADLRTQRMSGGDPGSEDTLRGITSVSGGQGDDVLIGDAGPNGLDGSAGADTLHGGDGDDALQGGLGADLLVGGDGDDRLTGPVSGPTERVHDRFDCGAGRDDVIGQSGDTVAISCDRVEGDALDGFRLRGPTAGRPAQVLVPRGLSGDVPADYRVEVRDARGRVRRTIRAQVTEAARARSRWFRVPLTLPVTRLRVSVRAHDPYETRANWRWAAEEYRIVLR